MNVVRQRSNLAKLLVGHGALYFGLGFLAFLLEVVVEQPKPYYGPDVTWFGLTLRSSAIFGAAIAAAAVTAISASLFLLRAARVCTLELDRAYYPQIHQLTKIRTHPPSAYAFLGVFLLLFCYWTWCLYENVVHRFYFPWHGWYWPPRVVLMTILVAWGGVWLAEALSRSTRQVLPVCCAYWICVLLIWVPLGCDSLVE